MCARTPPRHNAQNKRINKTFVKRTYCLFFVTFLSLSGITREPFQPWTSVLLNWGTWDTDTISIAKVINTHSNQSHSCSHCCLPNRLKSRVSTAIVLAKFHQTMLHPLANPRSWHWFAQQLGSRPLRGWRLFWNIKTPFLWAEHFRFLPSHSVPSFAPSYLQKCTWGRKEGSSLTPSITPIDTVQLEWNVEGREGIQEVPTKYGGLCKDLNDLT